MQHGPKSIQKQWIVLLMLSITFAAAYNSTKAGCCLSSLGAEHAHHQQHCSGPPVCHTALHMSRWHTLLYDNKDYVYWGIRHDKTMLSQVSEVFFRVQLSF
jgi:hypothetical protein